MSDSQTPSNAPEIIYLQDGGGEMTRDLLVYIKTTHPNWYFCFEAFSAVVFLGMLPIGFVIGSIYAGIKAGFDVGREI